MQSDNCDEEHEYTNIMYSTNWNWEVDTETGQTAALLPKKTPQNTATAAKKPFNQHLGCNHRKGKEITHLDYLSFKRGCISWHKISIRGTRHKFKIGWHAPPKKETKYGPTMYRQHSCGNTNSQIIVWKFEGILVEGLVTASFSVMLCTSVM